MFNYVLLDKKMSCKKPKLPIDKYRQRKTKCYKERMSEKYVLNTPF